jgi:hypothetical protein
MKARSPIIEKLTALALVLILGATFHYWDFVHQAYRKNHNMLAETDLRIPTSDLFLYSVVALIVYFGTRLWTFLAPPVFELTAAQGEIWRRRLRVVRVVSTFVLLGLTIRTVYKWVPDFLDKLPWP